MGRVCVIHAAGRQEGEEALLGEAPAGTQVLSVHPVATELLALSLISHEPFLTNPTPPPLSPGTFFGLPHCLAQLGVDETGGYSDFYFFLIPF